VAHDDEWDLGEIAFRAWCTQVRKLGWETGSWWDLPEETRAQWRYVGEAVAQAALDRQFDPAYQAGWR